MSLVRSAVRQVWPRLAAVAGLVLIWWLVYRSGYFSPVVLPSPLEVWRSIGHNTTNGKITRATEASLGRLFIGFTLSVVSGTVIGLLMVASKSVERSVGSLIIGLQSLHSIAWLPLAILWFGLGESAVLFVVVIGSLPSVALATLNSLRQVPPLLVVFPASIPGYVGGLQQGWAFAWRSLMAGELIIGGSLGLGQLLNFSRENLDTPLVLGVMVMIVIIGMTVDLAVFGVLDRRIRSRRGLLLASE